MALPGTRSHLLGGASVVLAVFVRPWLWATALSQVARLAPSRWWMRPPHVPIPDSKYLRFRATTAYGDPERAPEPDDVVTWLTWCRSWGRATKVQTGSVLHD